MKQFLKEHQRIISFVGLSIVLASFIVRELVRDYYKDLSDSLGQAQNAYSVLAQIEVAKGRLGLVSGQIKALENGKDLNRMLKSGPGFEDVKASTEDILEGDTLVIDDLDSAQNNLNHLASKLPAGDQPSELKDQAAALAQLKKERSELSVAMAVCDNVHQPDDKCSQTFVDEMNRKSDQLDVKLLFMGIDLTKMSRPIMEDAEQELSRSESRYGWATIGSAFFFMVGWLLSLAAAIYDLPGLAPKEP